MPTGPQGDNQALRRAVVQNMARKVAALRTSPVTGGPRDRKPRKLRGAEMSSLAMAAKPR
jgi:hypothetical protein